MARRKRPTKAEKPDAQTAIPFQETQAPEPQPAGSTRGSPSSQELLVFPHELHPGDRVLDDEPHEWQVVAHPTGYRQGKMIVVRMQKPGDPSVTRDEHWPAHQRVPVRREHR